MSIKWSIVEPEPLQPDAGPSFTNNAENSGDQEGAVKHWLDRAKQLQLQGAQDDDSLIAQLATEGCPQPDQVVSMFHMQEQTGVGQEQDQQPAVSSQDPQMPPSPNEAPDTSMYSAFKTYLSAIRTAFDDDPYGTAVQHVDQAMSDRGTNEGWSPQDVIKARQALLSLFPDKEQEINKVMNDLASDTWSEGHSQGGNSYFGPKEQWPTAKVKTADYSGHDPDKSPDHSAPGHNLPAKVNEIYHACMRDNPDYGKEKCMKIAWSKSGEKHEGGLAFNGTPGRVLASWNDMYDQPWVKFAVDGVGTFDIPESQLEVTEQQMEEQQGPVDLIQELWNGLPEVDETNAGQLEERAASLLQLHTAASNAITGGRLSLTEQVRLDEISLACRLEASQLKTKAAAAMHPDNGYLASTPKFATEVVEQASFGDERSDTWLDQVYRDSVSEAEGRDYDTIVNEEPAVLVNELPSDSLSDTGLVREIAARYIKSRVAMLDKTRATAITEKFVENAEQARRDALATRKSELAKIASEHEFDFENAPVEGLFL